MTQQQIKILKSKFEEIKLNDAVLILNKTKNNCCLPVQVIKSCNLIILLDRVGLGGSNYD